MTDDGHSPLIRVMALHAMAYCERLFYLEEVEEIRIADARVYAGRLLHDDLESGDAVERKSFEVASEKLGIKGKCDALRRQDGHWVPYEHKRGKALESDDGSKAWPSDIVQITAYAMLLEEHLGAIIPEGRIRYHTDKVTVRVPIDDEARRSVYEAIRRAHELRQSIERPAVAGNDRLCLHCSLAPVCLPEEERLGDGPAHEIVRLFPAERDGQVIHVVEPGARISRSADTLSVMHQSGEKQVFPINEVSAVVLHGYAQISTQAIHECARKGIAVHFLARSGRYLAGLSGGGTVQRRLRQFQALSDPARCLFLAKRLASSRAQGQLRYLLRATRGNEPRSPEVKKDIDALRNAIRDMPTASDLDTLRGYEGMASRSYFAALPILLRSEVPDILVPSGRSRRPPRDRFNAILSSGYSLLYQSVMSAIMAVGLDPAFGFFHTPRSSAYPLALDLMELFRVPVWDIALIGSINRLQWDPDADFMVTQNSVWLSDVGYRKAVGLYEERLTQTWKHPITGYSLSYERAMELEARLLEKEWTGNPGLFARARLR